MKFWYIVFMSKKGAYGSSSYKSIDDALSAYKQFVSQDSKSTFILCDEREYNAISNMGETIL